MANKPAQEEQDFKVAMQQLNAEAEKILRWSNPIQHPKGENLVRPCHQRMESANSCMV